MKTGNLTLTAGNPGNANIAAAIDAVVNPEAVANRGSIRSIVAGALAASVLPLTILINTGTGRVALFNRSLTADHVDAATDRGGTAWRNLVPQATDVTSPAWDVQSGGESVLTPLGTAPEGQTDVEAALSAMLRPVDSALNIAAICGMIEDAVVAGNGDSALILIRQDSAAGANDGQAQYIECGVTQGTNIIANMVSSHGTYHVETYDRAATATAPKGPFGI